MALRQAQAGLVAYQVAVIIGRDRKSQRPKKKNLSRRRLQQVRSADNLSDPHGSIVHHNRQLVGWNIIASPNNEVPEIPASDHPLWAKMQIRKTDLLTIAHAKSPVHPRRLSPRSDSRLGCPATAKPGGTRQTAARTAPPRINRLIVTIVRRGSRLRHILARASARIDQSPVTQVSPSLKIVRPTLTLRVGPVSAPAIRTFAPLNSKPPQIFEHVMDEFRTTALEIQIFIAQDQLPAVLSSALSRNPEGASVTEMQQSGRRRRQPPAVGLGDRINGHKINVKRGEARKSPPPWPV